MAKRTHKDFKLQEDGTEYLIGDIDKFIDEIKGKYEIHRKHSYIHNWSIEYLDIACAFDSESTSIIVKRTKTGFIYMWTICINGICIGGRTIEQLKALFKRLEDALGLNFFRRLVFYVNCLNFDWQFLRKDFKIDDIFIKEKRKPLYVVVNGIEFRCSYQLSGDSVDTMGKNLHTYKVKKLHNFDYTLCRNHLSEISKDEWIYAFHDVKVVASYVQELLNQGETIAKIPYTNTGFPRRDIRNLILKNPQIKRKIQTNIVTYEEYQMQRQALTGGYSYGNIFYQGEILRNILSKDITSSYPTCMLSELYAMGNGVKVKIETEEELKKASKTHFLLFRIVLYNVEIKDDLATAPISESKCEILEDGQIDNGKVVKASKLCLVTTSISYELIDRFYKFDAYQIGSCYQYAEDYLPKEYFETLLDYYSKKTAYKNKKGYEAIQMGSKKRFNAFYGLSIQEILRPVLGYTEDNKWTERDLLEVEEKNILENYNYDKYRFNMYIWGVQTAEYARRNLFFAIAELGMDFVYCDTDCVKYYNPERHEAFFERYNQMITNKLEIACDYYGIDKERLKPKTVDGIEKPLGWFVTEEGYPYKEFKFLHSKCYAGIDNEGNLHCTVAGIKKERLESYLSKFDNPLEEFKEGLTVPKEYSDKMCHTYCDEELTFEVTDYQGHTEIVTSKCGVHLEPIEYQIGISNEYQYLLSLMKMERA